MSIQPCYIDTSAAIKLIDQRKNGARTLINFLSNESDHKIPVSSILLQLELASYLRRVKKDERVNSETTRYFETLISHLLKPMMLKQISQQVLESAVGILNDSNISKRLRSLDSIHFATFLNFTETFPETILISSDLSLIELAQEYNKGYFNPETTVH